MLSLLMLAQVALGAGPEKVDPPSHQAEVFGCAHARSDAKLLAGNPQPRALDIDALADTDVLNYNLDLVINQTSSNSGTLSGVNIITVRCVSNNVTTFPLQLHSNFTITSLQVNGVNVTSVRQDVANVQVNLDHAYNANDQFDLRVAYNGPPFNDGFGSFTWTTQGGINAAYTLSEPY